MEAFDLKRAFGVTDFVVFISMLLLSLVIGLYYAYKDRHKTSVENYYFAGRKMSPIPIGLSIAVSFVSSLTILATPAHAYLYGSVTIWLSMSLTMQTIVACAYYIPLFQRLQLSSVYEYLELRYHKSIRLLASASITLNMFLYMGMNVYLTSLALSAATPLGMNLSIVMTAGICTAYTAMGGMKAVVWNDAFQSAIMVAGMFAVLIRTTITVGGFGNVWEALERGRRNTFWTFDLNPTTTHSFWSIMIGNGIAWTAITCSNQAVTQRYQSCRNVRTARQAAIISTGPMFFLILSASMTGCVMYAYFEGCDPLKSGKISKMDQAVVYLVMDIFKDTPGIPGLFVSAAYSGMLSTVSSGINSVGALILEDFIITARPNLKQSYRLPLSKLLSVTIGVMVIGMAFLNQMFGKTALQIVIGFFGTFGGPILGAYACGIHFPWTNVKGVFTGLVVSLTFSIWITLGGIFKTSGKSSHTLPLSDDLCPVNVTTDTTSWTTIESIRLDITPEERQRSWLDDSLYSISFMHYGMVGMVVCVVIAMLVSFATGKNDPKKMNPELFIPLVDNKHLPECVRVFFRFGVPEYKKDVRRKDSEEKASDTSIEEKTTMKDLSPNFRSSYQTDEEKTVKAERKNFNVELNETLI